MNVRVWLPLLFVLSISSIYAKPAALNLAAFSPHADGATDDTPAFTTCFAELAKNGGGTLTIPPGDYFMKGEKPVTLCSNVSISADGARFHLPTELGDKARIVLFSGEPTVVYTMLRELDPDTCMRVLDAGTGTGETAGLLSHRCGAMKVTTVDVDPTVSAAARERLCRAGLYADAVVGDALAGHPSGAPYDRLLCTFGVRSVPGDWLRQMRPGGRIVVPYGTHFSNRDAVVRLDVRADGTASGPFVAPVEFMKARTHRLVWPDVDDYVSTWPRPAGTNIQPCQLADAAFAISHAVPDIAHTAFTDPEGLPSAWFYSLTDRSWAAVRWSDGDGRGEVYQQGPRRLWSAVEAAHSWWQEQGRPGIDRFGLTVTTHGATPWLDTPGTPVPRVR